MILAYSIVTCFFFRRYLFSAPKFPSVAVLSAVLFIK